MHLVWVAEPENYSEEIRYAIFRLLQRSLRYAVRVARRLIDTFSAFCGYDVEVVVDAVPFGDAAQFVLLVYLSCDAPSSLTIYVDYVRRTESGKTAQRNILEVVGLEEEDIDRVVGAVL